MIAKKGEFTLGLGLLAAFFIVLIIFFSPIFDGKNGMVYLDDLYNTISKGSAYYVPYAKEESAKMKGTVLEAALSLKNEEMAQQAVSLFTEAGATAQVSGTTVTVKGDLAEILENCLSDADKMYANDGQSIAAKYGTDERAVLYHWWNVLSAADKALTAQEKFKAAKVVDLIKTKAVETAYNYYKVEPKQIGEKIWIVIFSLVFYVVYTLWYGFAIMFMFEGWGMKLEH